MEQEPATDTPIVDGLINYILKKASGKLYDYTKTLDTNATEEYKNKSLRGLLKVLISNKLITEQLVISFEGIDAIGKGTYSKRLESLLIELGFNAKRINIPTYTIKSGKVIAEALSQEATDEDLYKRRYEFANHFGVNRAEVKRDLLETNHDILIFDRWINSSVAFSISKILVHYGINKKDSVNLRSINELSRDAAKEVREILEYIIDLEYNIFDNYRVKEEFILHADISKVQERLNARTSSTTNDNDVHQTDAHENKLHLLETTQNVFTNIVHGSNVQHKSNQYLIDTTGGDIPLEDSINNTLLEIIDCLLETNW